MSLSSPLIDKKDILSYVNFLCTWKSTDIHSSNPYCRPLFVSESDIENLCKSKNLDPCVANSTTFLANRILFNIYEQDMLFLPAKNYEGFKSDFSRFYSEEAATLAHKISPWLESLVFKGFEPHINLSGSWSKQDVVAYLKDMQRSINEQKTIDLVTAIKESKNPLRAFKVFLIQGAADLLAEAAGAARGITGAYGNIQSELFTILIDEYGYGVHETKHSTIYEKLMKANGLNESIHYYWPHYMNSFLFLHNYVHYIYKYPRNFFKQIGSLFYAETGYARACKIISQMIQELWGRDTERQYYDEHAHIDEYHQNMALERVIIPLLEKYDTPAIQEIVQGAEEFRFIQGLCTQELIQHISFLDALDDKEIPKAIETTANTKDIDEYEPGKIIGPILSERGSHYDVLSGNINVHLVDDTVINLEKSQTLQIPKGIVHTFSSESASKVAISFG